MWYYAPYSSVVCSSAIYRTSNGQKRAMNCPTTSQDTFRDATGNEWFPYYELTGCVMPEFISSPIFLIIAAILAIFLVIAIVKGALRLFIWIAVIAVILIGLGIVTRSEVRDWFENLLKTVTG